MASEQFSSGPRLQCLTPATSNSGLLSNPVSQQPCIPPKRDDWDRLFQPMFNEYFYPPEIVVSPVQEATALRAVILANSPVLTSIYQDAPSIRSSSNVRQTHTPFEHLGRWTKDHPIENVISDHSRFVSTRKQLQTDALWCYFDAFLTSIEPKNFKQAMTEPSCIDAMQEEIHKLGYKFRNWCRVQIKSCAVDSTLFTQKAGNDFLLVQIYVDNIIFASTNTDMCNEFANVMTTKFKMSMMGAKPTDKHLNVVKRIFRYLKGAINMGIWYSKDTDMSLTAYADADHAGYIRKCSVRRDGKSLICCECECPLRGRFCWFCVSRAETSFANDPNPNSFDDFQNLSDYSSQPQYETYLGELCRNDSHYGYDCPPCFPLVYEQELSYNQNYNENYYPHNSSSFLYCENYGYFDVHQPSKEISIDELKIMMQSYCERMNQQREQEDLLAAQREQKLLEQEQAAQEKEEPQQNSYFHQFIREICGTKVCEEQKQNMEDTMLEFLDTCQEKELYCMHNNVEDLIESALNSKLLSINLKSQHLDKEKQEVKNIIEKPIKRRTRITESLQNFRIIHKMSSISNTSQISSVNALTPVLPTEEPKYSLSMGDEHLSTISETESDEVIKSSVKNLVPIPSEFEVTFDNESNDDKAFSNEDVPIIYSNSIFDEEEIILSKIDLHHFNAEYDLIESLFNRDTLIDSFPKFNYLLEEFFGKLAHIDPIPPRIKEADFVLEKGIHLLENLLYDNASPRLPKELNVEIADMIVESLSSSSIPFEDKGDIHFLGELLSNDPFPFSKNESSNFDHHNDPLFPRPPLELRDVEIFFDFDPDSGVLTTKAVEDISKHFALMPKVLPSLCPNIDHLLPFSSKNKEKVFKHGILSYFLVSHQDKIFLIFLRINDDVWRGHSSLGCPISPFLSSLTKLKIAPDLEASRARGFVHHPPEF
uniref:Reverse transcriptase Ty1/copia-type domain-containing protein n=1 Tax=Tanacetum cinerariifolium TaxID=118510 RepID=A0A6L2J0L0_TANCI|nr:hypothetical protein [Tanacetum cinerariifolium]